MKKALIWLSIVLSQGLWGQQASDEVSQALGGQSDVLAQDIANWNNIITGLQSDISLLPQDKQKPLQDSVSALVSAIAQVNSSAQTAISNAVNSAQKTVQGFIDQGNAGTLTQVQIARKTQETLAQSKKNLAEMLAASARQIMPQLTRIQQQVEIQVAPIKRKEAIEKNVEEQKKQREYQQNTAALVQALSKLSGQLQQARLANRKAQAEFASKGSVSPQTISSVTRDYRQLIKLIADAYQAHQVNVDFNHKTNLLSSTMIELIRFYLTTISLYLNKAQHAWGVKNKKLYHQTLYDLTRFLSGIGKGGGAEVLASGFGAAVKSIAAEVLPAQQDVILKAYGINKAKISMSEYLRALQDLVATAGSPTQEQLKMAAAYYYEIGTNFPYLDPDTIATLKKNLNSSYAFMLTLRAAALLKSMSVGKNNDAILNEVINAYGQAADYFSQAGDTGNQQQFQTVHDNLTKALKLRSQAIASQNAGAMDQAATAYQQAAQLFSQSNDTVDAQDVNQRALELQAAQSKKTGSTLLESFANQSRNQMQSYMEYISTLKQDPEQRQLFEVWLAQLATNAQQAMQNYATAIQQSLAINASSADLQAAHDALNNLITLQVALASADKLLATASLDALNEAQNNYYSVALTAAQKLDAAFAKFPTLTTLVPVYPALFSDSDLNQLLLSGEQWNFTTLIERHIAKLLIASISSMDALTSSQFLSAALSGRSPYLSHEVNEYLTDKLKDFAGQKQEMDTLIASAQKAEANARALNVNQWSPNDSTASVYASIADNAWKDVLRLYLTAYRLGSLEARANYLRAVQEYQELAQKNIPQNFYPDLYAATIEFRAFVLHNEANDNEAINVSFKQIVDLLKPRFDNLTLTVARISNPAFIANASDLLSQLAGFAARFDQLIIDQQSIIAELAPGARPDSLTIFQKSINTQQNSMTLIVTIPGQAAALSLSLIPVDSLSAAIYKSMGDYYFAQKDYVKSAQAYSKSKEYYNKLNQTAQANSVNDQYNLAYSRSYIDISIKSVIPNETDKHGIGTITVAGIDVPANYQLLNYGLEIPDYIPLSLTTDDIQKMAPDKLSELLVNYAFLLFVDQAFKAQGINYSDVFNGTQIRDSSSLSAQAQQIIVQGYQFVQNLKDRLSKKQSSLSLVQRKNAYGKIVFDLFEKYKPIPIHPLAGFSMTQVPYPAFPTVQNYYGWAQLLANPKTATITAGGQTYVSGNDQQMYNKVTELLAQAHLSAAALYQKRLDYLMNGGDINAIDPLMSADEINILKAARQDIQKLQKIDPNDMSVKLSDYMQTYNLIQNYAQSVIASYFSLASSLYDQLNDKQKVAAIAVALDGDLYKQLGDISQLFLIGDPFATEYFWGGQGSYGGVLMDVKSDYLFAVKAYGAQDPRSNNLIKTAASLFSRAGDILTNQKNFFGSVSLYSFAVGALKSMAPIDQKALDEASLKLLGGYYKGSSDNMIQYHNARSTPIAITLSTGEQETISLDDLNAKAGSGDVAESDKAQQIKEAFLEALVYYMGGSLSANQLAGGNASTDQTNNDVSKDPVAKSAQDLVNSYLAQINVSFDSVDSVMKWILSDTFAQTLNGAFDFFKNHILNAASGNDRLIGYRALGLWMNKLFYDAFSKVYMQDYLGGVSTDSFQLLLQSIKDEEQAIAAPADQWIG